MLHALDGEVRIRISRVGGSALFEGPLLKR
jgi:hypothetical protein